MIYLVSQAGNATVLLVRARGLTEAGALAQGRWRELGLRGRRGGALRVSQVIDGGSPEVVAEFNCPLGQVAWEE